jgi:hypothetical protein
VFLSDSLNVSLYEARGPGALPRVGDHFPGSIACSTSEGPFSGGASKIEPRSVCLVEILVRIEREPFHWPVGRVIFHKMAYFATEAVLHTGLHFVRESYGPFSPEVQALITRLVNNGVI